MNFTTTFILELLKTNKEHAISREKLCQATGLTDRLVRKTIEELRKEHVILSNDDGTGYYIAQKEDYDAIKAYRKRERARALSILKSLKAVNNLLDDIKHGRLEQSNG